ncbi:MAG: hypothetical protein HY716_09905 [Planctomycetes bacterium]|nr:hypothetical protein [Planctomycetota bacterium]
MNAHGAWIAPLLALAAIGCGTDEVSPMEAGPATAVQAAPFYADGGPLLAPTSDPQALEFESDLETLIGRYREFQLGLPPIEARTDLKDFSRGNSVHLAMHHPPYFDHQNPEGDLPEDRALWVGLDAEDIGENIAAGHATPATVFAAWLASEKHRALLEDPRWTHLGVGYAYDPSSLYGTYWTLTCIRRPPSPSDPMLAGTPTAAPQ